jgi:2-polyprenyl-6-methoxyphenol hydroxylase-like FAD-dependent oxidoreductase
VGINLAIQDAVATANLLAAPLREGRVTDALLAGVQRSREFPTRVMQFLQVNAHKGFEYVFQHPGELKAPWQFKVAVRVPGVQHVVARIVGVGIRPEHVRHGKLRRAASFAGAAAGGAVRILRRTAA